MFSEGDGYERFMGRWSRRLALLFVTFAGVTEGDRVLDVGSGTGALSAAAAAVESVQVTGIEPSPAYVRYAQRAQRTAGSRSVTRWHCRSPTTPSIGRCRCSC